MNEHMRSSTALVNQVLSNQDTLEKLKEDPEGTLRKVEAEVNQQLTLPDRKVTNFILSSPFSAKIRNRQFCQVGCP
ncbi:MAG: hypothetical protein HGB20_08910 [Chlorobiaceae bacterium]|nr:hypothetical protein [Chlorobiaceae bacterium]